MGMTVAAVVTRRFTGVAAVQEIVVSWGLSHEVGHVVVTGLFKIVDLALRKSLQKAR